MKKRLKRSEEEQAIKDRYDMIKILATIDISEWEQACIDFWNEYNNKYNS